MRLSFDDKDAQRKRALAVSFDLCGFSKFCLHPDAHAHLPKLIAGIFSELNSLLDKTMQVGFFDFSTKSAVKEPDFIKFSGDGALMLWFLEENQEKRAETCTAVVNAMRVFQKRLDEKLIAWRNEWSINQLPAKVRFGIATGHVMEIRPAGELIIKFGPVDYVGYCINLAVRLQDNSFGISFLIHKPVAPKIEGLIPRTVSRMKGVIENEEVLMFPEHENLLNPPDNIPDEKPKRRTKQLRHPMVESVKSVFEKSPREGVRRAYAYFLDAVSRVEEAYSYEFSDNYATRIADLIRTGIVSIEEKDRFVRIEKAYQLAESDPSFGMSSENAWAACEDIFVITRALNAKVEEAL